MGEILHIYHTDIEIPDQPDISEIENWGTDDPNEQFWIRKKLPEIFKVVTYDSDKNIVYTEEQKAYCLKELFKIRNGCWVMINGKATWLPGNYYYYLQYWTLENKKAPEYREVSRRYAIYRWYWKSVYWCLGILRGKGRRTGATSEITSNITCETTTNKNRRAGIISKTGRDSRKIFLYRVQFGYRHLPAFLQPTLENDKDSKTELVWNVPITKTKNKTASLIDEVEGINSMMDYQPPGLNAYDQERLTDLLLDEGGKLEPDVPFSELLSIISECLVEGGEKVGFAEMPSTVNKWNKGGEQFKIAWDGATWVENINTNEEDEDEDTNDEETVNRFVRYYCPAYDGLPGFIGKFGESIIEPPTEEQKEFLLAKFGERKYNGIYKFGSKEYLLRRRRKKKGADLEEEIRKYSFDEVEMFMSANADCVFDQIKINKQIEYLRHNQPPIRRLLFHRKADQTVGWEDTKNDFCWQMVALPKEGEENKFHYDGNIRKPSRTNHGVIAVDGYSNSQGGRKYGSKACGLIYINYDINDPENTGLFGGMIYGRPQYKEQLHEQIMLAAEYFGYEVTYEFTADDYDGYFRERGRIGYLGRFPLNSIDPEKRKKAERHRGYPITEFAITKALDTGILYVVHYCHKIYFLLLLQQMLIFDPYNRTKSDCVVSALIALVCSLERKKPEPRRQPLITVYKNENYKEPIAI